MKIKDITDKIVQKFGLLENDVKDWLSTVKWAVEYVSPLADIQKVVEALILIGQDTKEMKAIDFL